MVVVIKVRKKGILPPNDAFDPNHLNTPVLKPPNNLVDRAGSYVRGTRSTCADTYRKCTPPGNVNNNTVEGKTLVARCGNPNGNDPVAPKVYFPRTSWSRANAVYSCDNVSPNSHSVVGVDKSVRVGVRNTVVPFNGSGHVDRVRTCK